MILVLGRMGVQMQPAGSETTMLLSRTPLPDVEFVAFDLETTGLFPISCRIVEFGAVRFTLAGRRLRPLLPRVAPSNARGLPFLCPA